MAQIAVIMPKWIGDYVMALAVVENFKAQRDCEVTLLTLPYLMDLAKTLTSLEVHPYRTTEALNSVKNKTFDKIYVFPHSFSSAFWAFTTGIKNRIGYKKEGRSFLLTESYQRINRDRTKHITAEYSNLLGIEPIDISSVTTQSVTTEKSARIVLCPGAKYGPAKQWPHFSHLISTLSSEQFTILGGKDESKYAELLIKENPGIDIINQCGTESLANAAKILQSAKSVISNDSGLMHLGAYVGAKVIGIFGSSTPTWTQPLGKKSHVIWRNEECSPCFERECRYKHYHCLDKITVQEIITVMESL